jgi:hypothetical protein
MTQRHASMQIAERLILSPEHATGTHHHRMSVDLPRSDERVRMLRDLVFSVLRSPGFQACRATS